MHRTVGKNPIFNVISRLSWTPIRIVNYNEKFHFGWKFRCPKLEGCLNEPFGNSSWDTKSGIFAYCAPLEKVSLVVGRREACVDGWIPQCLGSNPISTNVNQSRCLSQHFSLSLFQVQKIWKVSKVRSCAKKVFAVLKNLQCLLGSLQFDKR